MTLKITNPILKGFNPDPSIIRVEDDFYLATSTFEWFPGVQLHHSRDLKNWELIGRPLNRLSQLDMRGNPDSCGVWAPCLSYDNGMFYLVYSNVRSFDGVWKDTPNYLVTTTDITGEWSDPTFLNSSGFDGSLFHDEDGRKWYNSMLVDHRKGKFFGGIILQEYDPASQQLTGPVHHIFEGTELGKTEGPHLYRKDGFYYLVAAEGGTEYGHAVTIARSKEITGPYEAHPHNPLVTSQSNPDLALQKSGHGDLVQDQAGNWFVVFLVGRPLTRQGRCILGRETAIQPVDWPENQWPTLKGGGHEPQLVVDGPELTEHPFKPPGAHDDFDGPELSIHFQSLRLPITSDWANLNDRPGHLRLYGRESLSSLHRQSLVARRIQSFHTLTTCCLEFHPTSFQQMAGLVCYYNTSHYFYLFMSGNAMGEPELNLIKCDQSVFREPLEEPIPLGGAGIVYLRADFNRDKLQFFYSLDGNLWHTSGPVLDGSILSDDYVLDDRGRYRPAFTGSFVGICCQDLTGERHHADFDWFEYREID